MLISSKIYDEAVNFVNGLRRGSEVHPKANVNAHPAPAGRLVPGPDSCTSAKELSSPAVYSITSSAWASSDGGTLRPSALAVLRLITSSYLVGACTGRSDTFAPFRMRALYPNRPLANATLWGGCGRTARS
jgi:hypothetical protein